MDTLPKLNRKKLNNEFPRDPVKYILKPYLNFIYEYYQKNQKNFVLNFYI